MLLLAHCSALFYGEQRETQRTKQTVSPTFYTNDSNKVLGERYVPGAVLGGLGGGGGCNVVARHST